MKKLIAVLSLLTTAISPSILPAQVNSPYELNTIKEVILLSGGLTLIEFSCIMDRNKPHITDSDLKDQSRGEVNAFDRSATENWSEKSGRMSDYIRDSLLVMPAALMLGSQPRSDFTTISILYLESILIISGLTLSVKSVVNRKRPFVYNERAPDQEKKSKDALRSFFSGHTATAFNSAVFFSTVFSDYYPKSKYRQAVRLSMLAAASTVGYLRYRAGKHYPSDILAGAVAGSITGYGIPYLHRKRNKAIALYPVFNCGPGLMISFRIP